MSEKPYRQTWHLVARRSKPTRKILQFLCGLIIRHELSETEWGYGGGESADRWCRWCNKMFSVPKDSIRFQFKETSDFMDTVGNLIVTESSERPGGNNHD
jgi:hypothetical protein